MTDETRRGKLRQFLRARRQDAPLLTARELRELLGDPTLSLRVIERDIAHIRENPRERMTWWDLDT